MVVYYKINGEIYPTTGMKIAKKLMIMEMLLAKNNYMIPSEKNVEVVDLDEPINPTEWNKVLRPATTYKIKMTKRFNKSRKPKNYKTIKELASLLWSFAKRYGWDYISVWAIATKLVRAGYDANTVDPQDFDWAYKDAVIEKLRRYIKDNNDWKAMAEKLEYLRKLNTQKELYDYL